MSQLLSYINETHMSYSYKPVLLLALISHDGHVSLQEATDFFIAFYSERISYGLVAEREDSVFSKLQCGRNVLEANIKANPFEALKKSELFACVNDVLISKEPLEDKDALIAACFKRLDYYYSHIGCKQAVCCFHKPDEENGYLSNWYLSPFISNGHQFSSTEQYIMYNKAMIFSDTSSAYEIMKTDDVAQIQTIGRGVKNYDDKVWDGTRQIIAYRGILQKFTQNRQLADMLLSTGNDILAECAVHDRTWGIGLSMTDKNRSNMDFWMGRNLLGFTLMQVRNEIAG